jgi:hypothetical protein
MKKLPPHLRWGVAAQTRSCPLGCPACQSGAPQHPCRHLCLQLLLLHLLTDNSQARIKAARQVGRQAGTQRVKAGGSGISTVDACMLSLLPPLPPAAAAAPGTETIPQAGRKEGAHTHSGCQVGRPESLLYYIILYYFYLSRLCDLTLASCVR